MRVTAYPDAGAPSAATKTRDQLVMLLQASLVIADTERWALEPSQKSAPTPVIDLMERGGAYEVAVVDQFHRTARSMFARAQQYAVWERAFKTGNRGRPEASDIAIFDSNNGTEVRLELGRFELKKLRAEAKKLKKLAATPPVAGYSNLENYVALWEILPTRLKSESSAKDALSRYQSAAARLTKGAVNTKTPFTITPLLASALDLFTAQDGDASHVAVGMFAIT